MDTDYGWIWVPDIEWAPAWVYWRVGGGFIGWAPCPPHDVVVAPAFFAFVEVDHFQRRVRPSTVIVNNTTIINKTTPITKVERETRTIGGEKRRVVINNGPGVDAIRKATGSDMRPVPIQEAARRTRVPPAMTLRASQVETSKKPAPGPEQASKPPESEKALVHPEQPRQAPEGERPKSVNPKPRTAGVPAAGTAPMGKMGHSHFQRHRPKKTSAMPVNPPESPGRSQDARPPHGPD